MHSFLSQSPHSLAGTSRRTACFCEIKKFKGNFSYELCYSNSDLLQSHVNIPAVLVGGPGQKQVRSARGSLFVWGSVLCLENFSIDVNAVERTSSNALMWQEEVSTLARSSLPPLYRGGIV